jgi:threonine dehydrogenase-like Zn-dependent dehydrogenase
MGEEEHAAIHGRLPPSRQEKEKIVRALVFQGPKSLAVEDRPIPVPSAGEALLRVAATGICGSDLHGYMGKTGRRKPGMIMGHEVVATIEQLGPRTERDGLEGPVAVNPVIACGTCAPCRRGLENLCENRRLIGVDADIVGGFAEFMVAPVTNLVPIGKDVPIEWGALVEPFAVGYRTARQGGVRESEAALIIGGGTIGIACLVAAKRLGADPIILSEPLAHRREAAAQIGAVVMDPTTEDVAAGVRALTDGLGVPAVLDCVGITATVSTGLAASCSEGTITVVGMESPSIEFPSYLLITQERRLLGNFGYTARHFREVAEWVSTAPVELDGYIEDIVGFDTVSERFHTLATGGDPALKIVLNPHA